MSARALAAFAAALWLACTADASAQSAPAANAAFPTGKWNAELERPYNNVDENAFELAQAMGRTLSFEDAAMLNERWEFTQRVANPEAEEAGLPTLPPLTPDATPADYVRFEEFFGDLQERFGAKLVDHLSTVLMVGEGDPQPGVGQQSDLVPGLAGVSVEPNSYSIPIRYFPEAFVETGVIARVGGEDAALTAWCSGARIAAVWVLTAAHCFAPPGVASERYAFAFFQNGVAGSDSYLTRAKSIGAGAVRSGQSFPVLDTIRFPDGQGEYGVLTDIALARVPALASRTRPVAQFDVTHARREVTLAGYGVGPEQDSAAGDRLRVSWVVARRISEGGASYVEWFLRAGVAGGNACGGDSGGPVYDLVRQGLGDEDRRIVGVISRGNCDQGPSGGDPRGVSVVLQAPHFRWLDCVVATVDSSAAHACRP